MASFPNTNTITLEHERRLCEVDDRVGYFHCWEQYADVLMPGLTAGSSPGGQYSRIFGIVEFEDGVERVEPSHIKFVDEENSMLHCFNRKESNE